MQRTDFGNMPCPLARSLGKVGEWWSILILRDAFYGLSRFDEFQKSLKIAPNMLTRRLNDLVEAGLLERRPYSDKPPRHEYVLTDVGRDFRPVMLAFIAWGNRHFAPEGENIRLVSKVSGAPVVQVMLDSSTNLPVAAADCGVVAGPAATEGMRYRLEFAERRRAGGPDTRFDPPAGPDTDLHS